VESFASHYLAGINNDLHYGTIVCLPTQILWFIACALVPFCAVTGFLLWRRRRRSAGRAKTLSV